MFRRTWQRRLKQLGGRTGPVRNHQPGSPPRRRPQVELLGDRLTSGAGISLSAGGAAGGAMLGGLATNNGAVNITANNVALGGAVNSGIGNVVITPPTPSLPIALGGADVAGSTLGLTDSELDLISTAGKVQIGDATYNGTISVTGPVTQLGSGYSLLTLNTAANVA